MSKNPPFCFICEKNYEDSVDQLHYCICDIAVCPNCLNSVKLNETSWVCPKCKNENNIESSQLFRKVK
ncbi:MAG: hypothetical protein ACFFAO_00875 [Candidatus Hermodarchaeota archaeon]